VSKHWRPTLVHCRDDRYYHLSRPIRTKAWHVEDFALLGRTSRDERCLKIAAIIRPQVNVKGYVSLDKDFSFSRHWKLSDDLLLFS
jgi:hypothetical protein